MGTLADSLAAEPTRVLATVRLLHTGRVRGISVVVYRGEIDTLSYEIIANGAYHPGCDQGARHSTPATASYGTIVQFDESRGTVSSFEQFAREFAEHLSATLAT